MLKAVAVAAVCAILSRTYIERYASDFDYSVHVYA